MIGNVTHGRDAAGVLRYVATKDGAYKIDGNLVFDDPYRMGWEFRKAQDLHKSINRYVWHISLSTSKSENIDDETWKAIARYYLDQMGFTKHQYVAYRHTDAAHHHIHLVVNRISIEDGTAVSDSWSKYRSELAMREIEKTFGLEPVVSSKSIERKPPKTGEVRKQRRDGSVPIRIVLQNSIDKVLPETSSPQELRKELERYGIETRFRKRADNTINGVSFGLNGVAFGGAKLGKRYSWTQIEKTLHHNRRPAARKETETWRRLYQSEVAQINVELTPQERDKLLAARLLKKGRSDSDVKAILTQSPVIQGNSKKDSEEFRQVALGYIQGIHKEAKKLLESTIEVER